MALLPALRLASLLLLVDLVLLAALAHLAPALAQLGLVATWLEAALRLPAFTMTQRLLVPEGPRGAAIILGLTPATFLTLRSLLVPGSAAPVLLATATPAWVALTHVAVAAALLAWAAPAPGGGGDTRSPVALGQLLALAWTEWPVLSGAFIFLVLAVLGETAGPYCTGKALDAIRSGEGPTAYTLGLVLAADLGSSLFAGCRGGLFILAQARLKLSTRHRLFSRLVCQDLAFFQETPAAELSARLANEVPLLCEAVPRSANVALRSLWMVVGLVIFMVGLSPRLALLALLEVPLVITARKVYDARYQVLQRAEMDARARTAAVVQETVSSIETVRTFAGEEEEEGRHGRAVDEMLRLRDRMSVESALFTLFQRALQLAMQVLVLYHGHQQLREGTITTGSLVTFLLYQGKVCHSVKSLVFGHGDLLSKVAAGRKIFDYLELKPTGITGGTQEPATLRGEVTFHRVSFSYPTRPQHLVLKEVSFELHPGKVTALAGLNGSGKSTCAGLLQRFHKPVCGEVLLDGVPLHVYEHHYLHRQRWGRKGGSSRPGRSSASPLPGPWCGDPLSSSLMKPPVPWMGRARQCCRSGCGAGGSRRCCSSPTARGCWRWLIMLWCWNKALWQRWGSLESCGAAVEPTAVCCSTRGGQTPRGGAARSSSPLLPLWMGREGGCSHHDGRLYKIKSRITLENRWVESGGRGSHPTHLLGLGLSPRDVTAAILDTQSNFFF
ncbi:antigen peptide transporter 2 isoform X3 [Apus apus]|uniref:antigen peptide transporter 2 isoform X3 n=1 Tax=Apus apus TaxID=8895 RepID=UPI0021F8F62E|nr:antigen peptide transporter 2 isoform X3 [Apus apus]